MRSKFKIGLVLTALLFSFTGNLCADQVILKNGNVLKGIVLEEYHDRIVLGVPYGQLRLHRKQIADIVYDRPEQNLLKMGNRYLKEGDTNKAIEYYKKALEENPDFIDAKDAIARVEDNRRKAEQRRKDILRKQREKEEEMIARLKESIGVEIEKFGDDIRVALVYPGTPASKADIKPGDIIVSIWDTSVKYQKVEKAMDLLIGEKGSLVTLTIRRQLSPVIKKIRWYEKSFVGIGISLKMEEKGLVVSKVLPREPADIAGVKAGDCIVAVKGKPTRYMKLKEAVKNMAGAANTPVSITISRRIEILRDGPDEGVKMSKEDSNKEKVVAKEKGRE